MGHYNPLRRAQEREEDASESESDEEAAAVEFAKCERDWIRATQDRRRGMMREAEEQMKRVREVRASREARAALEAEMEEIKRRLTEMDTMENAYTSIQIDAEEAAERAAAAMVEALNALIGGVDAHLLLLTWSDHESSWSNLEKRVRAEGNASDGDNVDSVRFITLGDVPWPPEEGSILVQMVACERLSAPSEFEDSNQATSALFRRAFKKASLRWHPDKFSAKFGRYLDPEHADEIYDRVQKVSQSINDEWTTSH